MTEEVAKPALNIYEMFASSEDAAENGKWFDFGPDMKVKVRRFKSKKSRKVREELEAPYKRVSQFGAQMPDEVQEAIGTQHVAHGLIADWKGVVGKDGAEIPYSKAAALKLCSELPEFRDAIANISVSLDNYRDDQKEAVEGN